MRRGSYDLSFNGRGTLPLFPSFVVKLRSAAYNSPISIQERTSSLLSFDSIYRWPRPNEALTVAALSGSRNWRKDDLRI